MHVELHSGIPLGKANELEQQELLEKIKKDLKAKGIDYIVKTTTGEFSRYFRKEDRLPIFVRYDNKHTPVKHIPLEECTDLFTRYPENRSITRVYIP